MTLTQEIICTLALLLWAVQCGCWQKEAEIARSEQRYQGKLTLRDMDEANKAAKNYADAAESLRDAHHNIWKNG